MILKKRKSTEPRYRDCPDIKDNIPYGCKNDMIKDIQICKGIEPAWGYFGPKTRRKLFGTTTGQEVITKDMYDTIMANCPGKQTTEPEASENIKRAVMDKFKKTIKLKGIVSLIQNQ
jgi:hypothetical protein